MTGGRYVKMSGSRQFTFTADSDQPARFLAALLASVLNHGMPARRRGGRVLAALGRRELPSDALARVLRLRRSSPDPGIDMVLELVESEWDRLAQRAPRLPDRPPPRLSALQMERSAARTVFVFGDDLFPLLVMKQPHEDHPGALREAAALEAAEPAHVGPRHLGTIGGFHVQEGLRGLPVRVHPVRPASAASVPWTRHFDELGVVLGRLGRSTAHPGSPQGLMEGLERAAGLSPTREVSRRVRATAELLASLDVCVLQHSDLTSQNWLVGEAGFAGLIDWELAVADGVPGFDLMQATMSWFDHGIGLTRWSDDLAVRCFRDAWASAPLFTNARRALREVAVESGVDVELAEALEIGFFARRLGGGSDLRRKQQVPPHAMAAMLGIVCGA